MRSFGASFAAEMVKQTAFPFWTVVMHFPTPRGDVYLSDRAVTIGGFAHEPVITSFGDPESIVGRVEGRLDMSTVDLTFCNVAGSLSSGERLSDLFGDSAQSVLADLYLNFELSGGSIVQELMFAGVVQYPLSYGFSTGAVRLYSLHEKYLSQPVLRTLSDAQFPYMRAADIGATVPIVIGSVPRCPTRVTKRGFSSTPVAADSNSSEARLTGVVTGSNIVAEDWTIAITPVETVAFAGPGNTDNKMGDTADTPRKAYAQSFSVAGASLSLTAVRLRMKSAVSGTIRVAITDDNAGQPGTNFLGSRTVTVTSTAYADVTAVLLPTIALTAGTNYWIVCWAYGELAGGLGYWHSASAGGYASHNAKAGTYPAADVYAYKPVFTWTNALDAHDMLFSLVLTSSASPTYSFTGSVTGADGTGTVNVDSVSTSGKVTIRASDWEGTPDGGDIFLFGTDPSTNHVVVAEAPSGFGNSFIGAPYWNGQKIIAQGLAQSSSGGAADIGKATAQFGVSHAQSFASPTPLLVRSFSVKLLKVGTPTEDVMISMVEDSSGLPLGRVLASGSVAASAITGSFATATVDLTDAPIVLPVGTYWIFVTSSQASDTAYYQASTSTTDVYTGGARYAYDKTNQKWVKTATDLEFIVASAAWTNAEVVDAAGFPVSRVSFDVAIPDDAEITVALDGVKDDVSGTFTGVPILNIKNPAAVIHWLLRRAGVPESRIDISSTAQSSFGDSNAAFGSLYAFSGVIQEQQTMKELLIKLAFECRSFFDWPRDKARLIFRAGAAAAIQDTIALNDLVAGGDGEPQITIERTDTNDVINTISVRYDRSHWLPRDSTAYEKVLTTRDHSSVDLFGELRRDDLFQFDFVRSPAMAADLAAYYLSRLGSPKRSVTLATYLPYLAVEKDDVIGVDLTNAAIGGGALAAAETDPANLPLALADALDGLDGGAPFRVDQIRLTTQMRQIEMTLTEF